MIRKVIVSCIIFILIVSCISADGLSVFKINDRYGYVNENLRIVIPPVYSRADPFNKKGYAIVSRKTAQYQFIQDVIDTSGESLLSSSSIIFGSNVYEDWYILTLGSKTKLINIETKEYASGDFNYMLSNYTDTDLIPVSIPKGNNLWEFGYVTAKGNVAFSNKKFGTNYGFSNGRAIVGDLENRNKYSAIIDESGAFITDYILAGTHIRFSEDLLAVKLVESVGGQTGYMNRNGQMEFYVPITYSQGVKGGYVLDATPFNEGYALIKTSKEPAIWRVINSKGEFVSEELSILAGYQFHDGFSMVNRYDANRKLCWSFIDTNGKLLVDFIFDSAKEFINGYAQIVYKGRDGLIDTKGEVFWSEDIVAGRVIAQSINEVSKK
jgi:hypothetical protein